MAFAIPLGMPDAESLSSRRGRRVLIALLILLLILLPLYLWPLRGGLDGAPGASALSGLVRDPRNAGALARIPGDVWDALMGHVDAPPASAPPATPLRNLTMITQAEATPGNGLDPDAAGAPLLETLVHDMVAQLGGSSDGASGGADTPSEPVDFLAGSPYSGSGGGTGGGNPLTGVGHGGSPGHGPLGGGAGGGGPPFSGPGPGSIFDPPNPGTLEPTPEPATLVLVGSNLALLGAAAWARRRRLPVPPTG